MRKQALIIAALITFSVITNAQTNWRIYNNKPTNTEIRFPNNWEMSDTVENLAFIIFTPMEGDSDRFRQNINLVSIDMGTEKVTINEFAKENIDNLTKDIKNFKKRLQRWFTWNGSKAFEIIYQGNIDEFEKPLYWKQRYLIAGNRAIVLTYTSDKLQGDKYAAIVNKIMDSLKALKE